MNPAQDMADELECLALSMRATANKLAKMPKPAPQHSIELVGAVAMMRNWAREMRKTNDPASK